MLLQNMRKLSPLLICFLCWLAQRITKCDTVTNSPQCVYFFLTNTINFPLVVHKHCLCSCDFLSENGLSTPMYLCFKDT